MITSSVRSSKIRRRHSATDLSELHKADMKLAEWIQRRQSSVGTTPPTPVLEPQRLPSIVSSAARRSTWRLSFAAQGRSSHLHQISFDTTRSDILDQAAGFPNTIELKWLRGQELRLTSEALSDPCGKRSFNPQFSQINFCTNNRAYAGVDGNSDFDAHSPHLRDLHISQRLAGRELSSTVSTPQLSTWGSRDHVREFFLRRGSSLYSRTVDDSRAKIASSSEDLQSDLASSSEKVQQSDGSSDRACEDKTAHNEWPPRSAFRSSTLATPKKKRSNLIPPVSRGV